MEKPRKIVVNGVSFERQLVAYILVGNCDHIMVCLQQFSLSFQLDPCLALFGSLPNPIVALQGMILKFG